MGVPAASKRFTFLGLLAVVFVLRVGEASAARVELLEVSCGVPHCVGSDGQLEVTDPEGASDVLTLQTEGTTLVLRGTPAPIAGTGCEASAPGEVRCTPRAGVVVGLGRVSLGAGDDRLSVAGIGRLNADGGPGDDALEADGTSGVTWTGGPGADRSSGARVTAYYAERKAPVAISFDGVANDGEAGEGDEVGTAGAASAGQGNDLMIAGATGSQLDGSDGDDQIFGGAGADRISGGRGREILRGGDGADILNASDGGDDLDGGAGDDQLDVFAPASAPDALAGGPGVDRAFVGGAPFRVDLAAPALDAPAGETGSYSGLEAVTLASGGGVGQLLGGPAAERLALYGRAGSLLSGGGGDDVLSAMGGTMTIDGGPGRDAVYASAAKDVLHLRDGEIDTAACPSGLTTLPRVDRADVLSGCGAPMVVHAAGLRLDGRALRVPVECPRLTGLACTGTVRAAGSRSGRSLARSRATPVRIAAGATQLVALRFGPQGARALRRGSRGSRRERTTDVEITTERHLRHQRAPARSTRRFAGPRLTPGSQRR